MLRYLLPLIILIGAFSCQIESAQRKETTRLTILSTFLESKDSLLFRNWSKNEQVQVLIRNAPLDSMIHWLQSKRYNTHYDLILCDNLMDQQKLHRAKVLQALPVSVDYSSFDSEQYQFLALGLNPYIFKTAADSIRLPNAYQALTTQQFKNNLTDGHEIQLLSAVLSRMNKVESFNWIKKYSSMSDSVQIGPELDYYSHVNLKKEKLIFPGRKMSGVVYNVISASIVQQSPNFLKAISFLEFYRKENANKQLNKRLQCIPISNPDGIRLYRTKPEELVQYHSMVDRMLKKLD